MATLENTYFTELSLPGAGASGIQYFALSNPVQPIGSVFAIKSMTIQSDVGIGGGGSGFNYILYTSDDAAGLNQHPISCNANSVVPAIDVIDVFEGSSLYLTKPYMGINIDMPGAGTVRIVVVYALVPSTNTLSGTFKNLPAGPSTGTSIPISSDAVNTLLLTSSIVTNSVGDATYTVRFFYRPNLEADFPISDTVTLAPYEQFIFVGPLYFQPVAAANSLVITSTGVGAGLTRFTSYISYT